MFLKLITYLALVLVGENGDEYLITYLSPQENKIRTSITALMSQNKYKHLNLGFLLSNRQDFSVDICLATSGK